MDQNQKAILAAVIIGAVLLLLKILRDMSWSVYWDFIFRKGSVGKILMVIVLLGGIVASCNVVFQPPPQENMATSAR